MLLAQYSSSELLRFDPREGHSSLDADSIPFTNFGDPREIHANSNTMQVYPSVFFFLAIKNAQYLPFKNDLA